MRRSSRSAHSIRSTRGCCCPPGVQQLGATRLAKRRVRYEQIIIDSNYLSFRRRFKLFTRGFFDHFLKGAAVTQSKLSKHYQSQLDPFVDKVAMSDGGFAVVHTENNQPSARSRTSRARRRRISTSRHRWRRTPGWHDTLHVMPQYEAA